MKTDKLNIPALSNRVHKLAMKALETPQAFQDSRWYEYAGQWCNDLDEGFDLKSGTVAGFVAALSPLNSWESQLKFTPPSIQNGLALICAGESAIHGISGPGFFSNRDKAARILAGESPLDVLGGDKVRSFYRNLLGDGEAVTIDRHALAIVGLPDAVTSKRYHQVAKAYVLAGKRLGLSGAEIQALTWNYWRRNHAAHNKANSR
jgi:hypothetical protein